MIVTVDGDVIAVVVLRTTHEEKSQINTGVTRLLLLKEARTRGSICNGAVITAPILGTNQTLTKYLNN